MSLETSSRNEKEVAYQLKKEADLNALRAFLRMHNEPEPYWTTDEATSLFKFEWFGGPGVAGVVRREDNVEGTLLWADAEAALGSDHYGRLYFRFKEK